METKETTTVEKTETTVPAFDPKAFSGETPVVATTTTTTETPEKTETASTTTETTTGADGAGSDDDFVFNWEVDEKKDEKTVTSTETKTSTEGNEKPEDDKNKKAETVVNTEKSTTFEFADLSKELGLTENVDKETFGSKVKEILKENEQLRSLAQKGVESDALKKLDGYKRLDDEALVAQEYKLRGMSDEEVKDVVDAFKTNKTLKAEALVIRNNINNAIAKETKRITDLQTGAELEKKKAQEKSRAEFKEHLNKTNEMFGFKLGKSEDDVQKARTGLYEYVTSGKFAGEIFENDQNLAQAAYLWRNRETLFKALRTQGTNQGRKQVLDHLQNPETVDTRRVLSPESGSNEFNAQKFMAT